MLYLNQSFYQSFFHDSSKGGCMGKRVTVKIVIKIRMSVNVEYIQI